MCDPRAQLPTESDRGEIGVQVNMNKGTPRMREIPNFENRICRKPKMENAKI